MHGDDSAVATPAAVSVACHKIRSDIYASYDFFFAMLRAMTVCRILFSSTVQLNSRWNNRTGYIWITARQFGNNASWRRREVGRGCPAITVQQRLLLHCLRDLPQDPQRHLCQLRLIRQILRASNAHIIHVNSYAVMIVESCPGLPGAHGVAMTPAALPPWLALLLVCLAVVSLRSVASIIIPT